MSQATKNFLHGEFELEDGHGGDREDELKKVTTFLVKAVLKPVGVSVSSCEHAH